MLPERMTGGCQCGACRYEIASKPLFGYACHCLNCRRNTGSAFSASVIVAEDTLTATGPIATWMRPEADGAPLEARFCSACGVRLFHHDVPRAGLVRVKVGTVDDADWFRPAAEFYTRSRLPFVNLGDDTIECVEAAQDRPALLAAWQALFPEAVSP